MWTSEASAGTRWDAECVLDKGLYKAALKLRSDDLVTDERWLRLGRHMEGESVCTDRALGMNATLI